MIALREIVTRDTLRNFEVPKEFGDEFEMILVPVNNIEKNSDYKRDDVSENEQFLGAVYSSTIEENEEEDKIWSKYL